MNKDNEVKAIYDEFADGIYSFLLRLCRFEETALDLMQETFVRAIKYYEKADSRLNVRGWLYKIAHNVFKDWLANQLKTHEHFSVDHMSNLDSGADHARETDFRQLKGQIIKLLLAKNPVMAEAFLLRVDEGLAYNEIASTLAVSDRTVRRLFTQIKKFIREEFLHDLQE